MKTFRTEHVKINGWNIPVDVPVKSMTDEEFVEKMNAITKKITKK